MGRYWSKHSDVFLIWRSNTGAQRAYLLGILCLALEGGVLILGGPGRTSAPSYRTINELGGPDFMGAWLLVVAGLLALAPLRSLSAARIGLLIASVSQIFMAVGFLRSALIDSHAGFLGIVNLTIIALWLISHSEIYRTVRR